MNAQPIPVHEPTEFQVQGLLQTLAHRQAVHLFHEAKAKLVERALAMHENQLVAPSRGMPTTM